jgi:FkbM family methyltransferase
MSNLNDPVAIRETIGKLNAVQHHDVNEGATRVIYSKIVTNGDVVLDCGANCGFHTRTLVSLVGPEGRVHAFEPNPDLFATILALGPSVRLWPFAVGDALAVRTLFLPEGLNGWASLTDISNLLEDRNVVQRTTIEVPIDELAELRDAKIRFAKIDVERNELPALRGMLGLIARSRPVIILESVNADIIRLLAGHGYGVWDLTGTRVEQDEAILPNAAALPEDMPPEQVAALLLSPAELRALIDEVLRPAEHPAPKTPEAPELPELPAAIDQPTTPPEPPEPRATREQELEAQLARLTSSLSWRVTEPLRSIRRWFG